MIKAVDIAIAGANHTGLALALALGRLIGPGLRVALLDRRDVLAGPAPVDDPRALALSAGSVRLLAAIGVWPRIAADAQPVTAIEVTDSALEHAIRPVRLGWENQVEGAPATWIVPSGVLANALVEAARAAADIIFAGPAEVGGFSTCAAGIDVHLSSGAPIRAGLLVAADGARSPVRRAAGIRCLEWSSGQAGIVATIAHERPHEARAVQHFLPAGPFAMLPLVGNRSCITWTETAARARELVDGPDDVFLHEASERFGYKLGALSLAGPRALWPLDFHVARALAQPGIALIGDAARRVHPLAGQGLNLGLRDVAALAEVVADAVAVGLSPGDATGLERYERWRRFDGSAAAAAFGALNTLFSNDAMLLRAARGVGLGIVDRLPGLKQLLVAEAAGLTGDVPRLMQAA